MLLAAMLLLSEDPHENEMLYRQGVYHPNKKIWNVHLMAKKVQRHEGMKEQKTH